jgi:acyl-coenzyme A thioesterase 13
MTFKMTDSTNPALTNDDARLHYLQTFIGKTMQESHSPVGRWLNGTMLDIQKGSIKVEFVVRKDMSNPMGILHGGIAATILDEIVGTMVYALGREFAFVSVNLNCDFLNPAMVGETIFADAEIIRAGKNIVHVEGKITNSEGIIIAKCTSNLLQSGFKIPPEL